MKTVNLLLLALLASMACASAQARDAFDKVRCGSDIRAALTGASLPDGAAAATEARHKNIALKDLGADEISDDLQMVSWSICGGDYNMLVGNTEIIRDVLPFPPHSRSEPEFGGICKLNGKDDPDYLVAVLDNKAGADPNPAHHVSPSDATLLSVEAAWKIDEKYAKFVKLDASGLRCARSGINTVDGGP